MRNYLPDHPWIYVPIKRRCNREITYTHEITQCRYWGDTIAAFAHVKLQTGVTESVVPSACLDGVLVNQIIISLVG